jgi:uncharacterized protein (TIGR03067 family)
MASHTPLIRLGAGVLLVAGLLHVAAGFSSPVLLAQERALRWEGQYRLLEGKIQGKPLDEAARKAEYHIDAKAITIKGKGAVFVIQYQLDTSMEPIGIDMVIAQGPEGTKGSKAVGIVAFDGKQVKLAYAMSDKRPVDFSGKDGMYFLLEKLK